MDNFKISKFNSNEEFLNHLYNALENDKVCNFIETYSEKTEVHDYQPQEENEVDFNCYFLNEDFTIQDIAIMLLQDYGSDISLKIDTENMPQIELEDGTKIIQKTLVALIYPECEYGFVF